MSSSIELPATIKALQLQSDQTLKIIDIPFATNDKVRNLADDEVLIRVRAVGLNPTDWKAIIDVCYFASYGAHVVFSTH